MSNAVEIYICKKGQALKEGKVEYSQAIYDKYGAEDDAKARIQRSPSIHKIAYYKINDEGDFRIFYSFTNKDLNELPSESDEQTKKPKRKKPQKRSFWQKLLGTGSKNKNKKKNPAKKK